MGCEISKLCSSEKRQPVLSASDSPAAEQADLEMSTAGASHCAAVTYTAAPGATKVVVTAPESLETPDGSGHLQQVLVLTSAAKSLARQQTCLQA